MKRENLWEGLVAVIAGVIIGLMIVILKSQGHPSLWALAFGMLSGGISAFVLYRPLEVISTIFNTCREFGHEIANNALKNNSILKKVWQFIASATYWLFSLSPAIAVIAVWTWIGPFFAREDDVTKGWLPHYGLFTLMTILAPTLALLLLIPMGKTQNFKIRKLLKLIDYFMNPIVENLFKPKPVFMETLTITTICLLGGVILALVILTWAIIISLECLAILATKTRLTVMVAAAVGVLFGAIAFWIGRSEFYGFGFGIATGTLFFAGVRAFHAILDKLDQKAETTA